ncbi:hypothetical protein B0H66DRAFT_643601 [Apodospora peruviana]|uniref:Fungal calcium binding protein domain-containing protein n=1 Tax=Apodospora peruviana TaxID=516989 RepID=A0AAE0HY94_9PEZI|nr:hypothetical protein B0H66DRAFT_643601 [Apodospora peruviana]
MKFAIISVLALLAPAMAAPSAEPLPADTTALAPVTLANINEAEVFSFAPPSSCSILSCIQVIGEAICIANAIKNKDYKGILKCAKKKELCGCAGCYSDLGDFLDEYSIC